MLHKTASMASQIVILAAVLEGGAWAQTSPPPQGITQCTLSNGVVTGPFGGYDVAGTFSGPTGAVPTTSSITVNGPGIPYSYTFTGPLNGPGYTQTSEIPPPPCILGCPVGGYPPGSASLHVFPDNANTSAALAFTDSGEPFNGSANLSCIDTGAPPGCSADSSAARLAGAGTIRANDEVCKPCVPPTNDSITGWNWNPTPGHETQLDFQERLVMLGATPGISKVQELPPTHQPPAGPDTCYANTPNSKVAQVTGVTGSTWDVTNILGFYNWGPDTVGFPNQPNVKFGIPYGAVTYYQKNSNILPCGYTVYQQMWYFCPLNNTWFQYGPIHTLTVKIGPSWVTVQKDGVGATRRTN